MKNKPLSDFRINTENNTVHITREFAANVEFVWNAWTKPMFLDQWWAPKPYRTETRSMDFKEGGMWLYAMISPENETHWSKAEYKSIEPTRQISWLDAFCDENGNENPEMPHSLWTINFIENNGITSVNINIRHDRTADLEMLIQMGFKEGINMAFENLDKLLLKL
ncbi:MAG: SRPBCC domain-containing protein [Bacteroidales bacterium]|jgi:uncharacterized protein YndB with AHSA1/START domain|nr:SRPBCC domain-containing protein [Bacteroidales bacterium]